MKTSQRICFALLLSIPTLGFSQEPAEMNQEQAAMMEAWMAAASPGEPHLRLAELAGSWHAVVEAWMEPGAEPMISESNVERVMSLDGRVLEERWTGSMMGMPFQGHGRTGYDNVADQYWSTWTDTMSTGVMMFTGQYDAEAKQYDFSGSYLDPMTKSTVESRSVGTMPEEGKEMMVMYETHDGEEIMVMRMVLTRQ